MNFFERVLGFQRYARALRRILPLSDTLKLAWRQGDSGDMLVHLTPVGRGVIIRLGTSDLTCMLKVFLSKEYSIPFEISPKVIVDAGANIGMATLYYATQYPEAKIIAIEPEPSNFKILQQNCGGLPNVTLIEAALWPVETTIGITNPTDEKWAFRVNDSIKDKPETLTVPAITIGTLLKKTAHHRIDLLKLDIESAELELFSSNPESWLDNVQTIAIELHDRIRYGCAEAFYRSIVKHKFRQEVQGENILINFEDSRRSLPPP